MRSFKSSKVIKLPTKFAKLRIWERAPCEYIKYKNIMKFSEV